MLALLVAASAAVTPLPPAEISSAYRAMLSARYASAGRPVPAGGVEFEIDSARFRLESGSIRAMEPVAGGRTAGFVFEGRGRLALELPDARELEQFRRFAEQPAASRLETTFTKLVLRDGGGLAERVAGTADCPCAPNRIALDRQEVWLESRLVDADAWAARALAGDGAEWALAELESPEHGWLAVEFDPDRAEELQVAQWRPDRRASELWVSLDRAAERAADGRPASSYRRQFDLLHAEIRVDLTEPSRRPKAGLADIQPRHARFEVELRFRPLRPEARTLAFVLDPFVELTSLTDERGVEVPFLRDHVGLRSAILDDELWDNTAIALFAEPLGSAERKLEFVYEGDILNYVGGRDWYPGEQEAIADPHTADIALTALPKHDLRAMGRPTESRDEKGRRFRRWAVERPVRTVTFAFAERFEEERVEQEGAPPVIAFSSHGGARNKVYNVAADVSNAWRYFAERFGPGPEMPELWATAVIGGHGQAFEGFLHLGEGTWEIERRGPTELFRAHEVAHHWWGHLVGWATYRDQWLSEALAEYSAMRFVEATVEDGSKLYEEMVETFAAVAMGEGKVSRFQRGFRPAINTRHWARVGPIALGYRASTADVPDGYQIQCYYRGALALHMLRRLFAVRSGSDALFDSILADFAREFRGREASTADFAAVIARRAPADWSWFFRQWIERTDIPTWRWQWRAGRDAAGGEVVTIEVEQEGVRDGFKAPVPVLLDWGGSESRTQIVVVDEPRESFSIAVPRAPKRVVFNPGFAVLARTVRR